MVLHGPSLTARDMPAAGPVGTGSGATCTSDGAGRPAARAPVRTPAGTGSQPRRRASPVGTCHRLAAPRESRAPGEPGAGRNRLSRSGSPGPRSETRSTTGRFNRTSQHLRERDRDPMAEVTADAAETGQAEVAAGEGAG